MLHANATNSKSLKRCAFESRMTNIAGFAARATGIDLQEKKERRIGAFQLIGVDFLISGGGSVSSVTSNATQKKEEEEEEEEQPRPYWIEGNVHPGMSGHNLLWKRTLGIDLWYVSHCVCIVRLFIF